MLIEFFGFNCTLSESGIPIWILLCLIRLYIISWQDWFDLIKRFARFLDLAKRSCQMYGGILPPMASIWFVGVPLSSLWAQHCLKVPESIPGSCHSPTAISEFTSDGRGLGIWIVDHRVSSWLFFKFMGCIAIMLCWLSKPMRSLLWFAVVLCYCFCELQRVVTKSYSVSFAEVKKVVYILKYLLFKFYLVTDRSSLQWLGCMGATVGKAGSLSGAVSWQTQQFNMSTY